MNANARKERKVASHLFFAVFAAFAFESVH